MATPTPSALRNWSMTLLYLTFAALAAYYMRIMPQLEFGIDKYMAEITQRSRFRNGHPLRQHYTGVPAVDVGLSFLVVAFIDGTAGWDRAFQLQQVYFLVSFFAVVCIWSAEAGRGRNGMILTSLLFVWTLAYQTVGGAVIVPLYYLAYTWTSARGSYYDLPRAVERSSAKALLPAGALGYLVPTALLFWPFADIETKQLVTALWQPAPLFPILLMPVLSAVLPSSHHQPTTSTTPADVKHLQRLYIAGGLVAATVHLSVVYIFLTSSDLEISFSAAFLLDRKGASTAPAKALLYIFQVDFWIIFASSLVWCWQAVWDLNQIKATDIGLVEAGVLVAMASVVFGPGAAMSAVWYWREGKMVAFEKRSLKKQ